MKHTKILGTFFLMISFATACGVAPEGSELAGSKKKKSKKSSAISVASCSYSINGKSYKGSTKAECEKLKAEIAAGQAPSVPALPAEASSSASASSNGSATASASTSGSEGAPAAPAGSTFSAEYSISSVNGKEVIYCSYKVGNPDTYTDYFAYDKESCDDLKAKYGTAAVVLPAAPAPLPNPAPAPGTSSSSSVSVDASVSGTGYKCAYNSNGKAYEGKSEAECAQIKKDLGF